MFKLSKRSLGRLEGVNPILIDILLDGIKDSPYDFGIPRDGGLRTSERQRELFDKKVSNCDGFYNKSYHQSGNAFDIYLYIDGKASWDRDKLWEVSEHLILVALTKFNINLRNGGDWNQNGIRVDKDPDEKFYDGCHFEIK